VIRSDIRIYVDFEGSYCFAYDGHEFRNWFVDAWLHQELAAVGRREKPIKPSVR